MTARLLSATMDTHTIAQGAPDFKGRGIVAFGNGKTSVGTTPAVIPGYASVGFQDETQGIASCLGFNRQPLVFDASGSGSPGLGPFLAEISGATSTIDPRMEVDAFGCGSVEVSPVGSGS